METNNTNDTYVHPKFACRRYARQLWRENPNLSIDEMLERYEIKEEACKGICYEREDLLNWILPDFTPHQELENFRELPLWKLEEAVALWLDINPFILLQPIKNMNPDFWHAAFHPNLRERYSLLLEKSQRFAISGQLPSAEIKGQYWVTPRDFHGWAMKNDEILEATRIINFFADLQESWSETDASKKESKVEMKIREIRRILNVIKASDPEFDSSNMPGRKEDFHKLCMQLNKPMFSIARATFNDYLFGVCSFNAGARATDYYSNVASKLE